MSLRAWIISDTHNKHSLLKVPEGIDIVFHAGDMGSYKDPHMNVNGMLDSLAWYRSLPIKYKILIPGNHCTSIERNLIPAKEFEGITFLNHEYAEVAGLKIFGSGYTPAFHDWAFNVSRHKIGEYWKDIPEGLDVLLTHGPPQGIMDLTYSGGTDSRPEQVGDKALLNRIKAVKPRWNFFGHIHPESNCYNAGIMKVSGIETTFINAAVLNLQYNIDNNGFVIDI